MSTPTSTTTTTTTTTASGMSNEPPLENKQPVEKHVKHNAISQSLPKPPKNNIPKDPKKPREPKEKKPKAPKAPKENHPNEQNDVPRENKPKQPKEPKHAKDAPKAKPAVDLVDVNSQAAATPAAPAPSAPKQVKQPREPKQAKQPKQPKDPKQPKEPKQAKQPKQPKEKKPKQPKQDQPTVNQPNDPVFVVQKDFTQIHLPPLPAPVEQTPKLVQPKEQQPKQPKQPKEKKQLKESKEPKQPKEKKQKEKKPKEKNGEKQVEGAKKKKSSKPNKEKGEKKQLPAGAEGSPSKKEKKRKSRFPPHISIEEVEKGVAASKYFYGQLRVNPKKYNDAYVTIDGVDNDAFCDGLKFRNRGFHTDIVVFEILPEEEWKNRSSNKEEEDERPSKKNVDKNNNNNNNNYLSDAEDSDIELAAVKDASANDEDNGTIVLQSSLSKLSIENRDKAELSAFASPTSQTSYTSTSDDEDEIIIGQDSIAKELREDDFVVINPPSSSTPLPSTTSTKPEKKSRVEVVKGLKQNIKLLQATITKANTKNQFITIKVVHILEARHTKTHIGLITNDTNNSTFANFNPMDSCLPRCLIFKESIPEFRSNPDKYKTLLVSVTYSAWKDSSILPIGSFHSIFGECGEIEPETKALLREYNVDTNPFSKEVMDCLPKISDAHQWKITAEDLAQRRDLRNEIIVSIDPDTAKDLDDALSCVRLPDGNFEVGVHIADVSHFVKPGTALDASAQQRATTVYLVQKAIPMLPSLLSEELCSLNYGVERFAFSVIWTLSPDGKVLAEWFGRSVIKSASRLTYGIAQTIIDGRIKSSWKDGLLPAQIKPILGPDTPEHVHKVVNSVMNLREIAKRLRQSRMDNGAFNIHPTKLAFELDAKGNPVSTKIYPIYESNNLVEEFMLLANMQVASRIAKYFPENALLRRHPNPNPRKLDQFINFCTQHGWEVDPSDVSSFGTSVKALREQLKDQPNVFAAIQIMSIRSMRLAEYFCTGSEEEDQWHHYALNVDHYTHFTSPIRRYADIIVHRLLELSIQVERAQSANQESYHPQGVPSTEEVALITKNCNEKKLNSRKAQERSDKVFLCVLLQNTLTITDAVVLNGGPQFLSVIVPMFGTEQRVYLDDLQTDGQIISHSYDKEKDTNYVIWPGTSDNEKITQEYKQLSCVKVKISVDKSKFPIDTRCTLMHPLYVNDNN